MGHISTKIDQCGFKAWGRCVCACACVFMCVLCMYLCVCVFVCVHICICAFMCVRMCVLAKIGHYVKAGTNVEIQMQRNVK